MTHFIRRRRSTIIPWLLGFMAGMLAMNMEIFLAGEAGGSMIPGMVRAEEDGPLPAVFYNDSGQKVCVRQDAVLELEKALRIELPLRDWAAEETGLLEMRLYLDNGTVLSGRLTVQKK